jgi:hypothetical protein
VTCLARREERVVEVQVAHERAVVERGAVGCASAGAYERRQRGAAELPHLLGDHSWWVAVQRPEGAPERVQHPELQLLTRRFGDLLKAGRTHEPG